MAAADSFDGKGLANRPTIAADGDGSRRTVVPASPGTEPAGSTGESEGRDRQASPVPTSGAETLDPSDPAAFILQDNPPTATGTFPPHSEQVETVAGRTVAVLPPDDPSDVPTMVKPDTAAPPVRGRRYVPAIAGYEILGELGRGGMGVVYRARQVLLNRSCALKMILAGAHADAQAALRFLSEAESVARLHHPNIV